MFYLKKIVSKKIKNKIKLKKKMDIPPLGDLPSNPRRPYVVSPRPRNLFGHCYMPPSIRKKYVYNATPRRYTPPKNKRKEEYERENFTPMIPITTMIHSPRPIRKSPAEIRREILYRQMGIDMKSIKREIRELNKWNQKAYDNQHQYDKSADAVLDPAFVSNIV